MATLHIEHPITDLDTWLGAFNSFADARKDAGVRMQRVRQPVGDHRYIVVDLEFDDPDAAHGFREFLEAVVWQSKELSPGLDGVPTARVLDDVAPDRLHQRERGVDQLHRRASKVAPGDTIAELIGHSVEMSDDAGHPDLRPADERTALVQRLDQYRAIVRAAITDVEWDAATAPLLPATDMTLAGIVRHLAWAEDRWFQGRLLGLGLPPPWDAPGADDPDQAMRLSPGDSVAGIVQLYSAACDRSRATVSRFDSLDTVAMVPSFGRGPVNLRWILVHMIEETARHAGHLDLLRDCLGDR